MPRPSPYSVLLSGVERRELESQARQYTSPYYSVVRAKIVLLAADRLSNEEIGARLSVPRQIVSNWRKRFFDQRTAGLHDEPRTGRPPSFSPEVVVQIKAMACELPATSGLPLSRFSREDLVREAAA
jgi:hypothetical protein